MYLDKRPHFPWFLVCDRVLVNEIKSKMLSKAYRKARKEAESAERGSLYLFPSSFTEGALEDIVYCEVTQRTGTVESC